MIGCCAVGDWFLVRLVLAGGLEPRAPPDKKDTPDDISISRIAIARHVIASSIEMAALYYVVRHVLLERVHVGLSPLLVD